MPDELDPVLLRQIEILELFAEAHHLFLWRASTESGGLEALRRDYRRRQASRGLCVSCPRPAVTKPGRWSLCHVHVEHGRERARRFQARKRQERRSTSS